MSFPGLAAGMIAPPGDDRPVGEIWFQGPEQEKAELLVKYIFTSRRLSIQVHPDDLSARARGHERGKDEAWFVIAAEPGALIGLGPRHPVSPGELRDAVRGGGLESLLAWRKVRSGDVLYAPGGTIHAIGGGLSLIEIQQNLDLTYRLYDYGSARELHIADALAVAVREPWRAAYDPVEKGRGRMILAAGRAFVLERWTPLSDAVVNAGDGAVLLVPLAAGGALDGADLAPGTVWSVTRQAGLRAGADLLAAYPGEHVREDVLTFEAP